MGERGQAQGGPDDTISVRIRTEHYLWAKRRDLMRWAADSEYSEHGDGPLRLDGERLVNANTGEPVSDEWLARAWASDVRGSYETPVGTLEDETAEVIDIEVEAAG